MNNNNTLNFDESRLILLKNSTTLCPFELIHSTYFNFKVEYFN